MDAAVRTNRRACTAHVAQLKRGKCCLPRVDVDSLSFHLVQMSPVRSICTVEFLPTDDPEARSPPAAWAGVWGSRASPAISAPTEFPSATTSRGNVSGVGQPTAKTAIFASVPNRTVPFRFQVYLNNQDVEHLDGAENPRLGPI